MTSTTTRTARARHLEAVALELFAVRGFDAVTVDDLAAAGGVGRRTFFRYFPTKLDVVLGELDDALAALVLTLRSVPDDADPVAAAREAFLRINAYADDDVPVLRRRLRLIETVPEVAARAAVRYAAWERAVADDAASRWGCAVSDLRPQVFARVVVAAMRGVFTTWLDSGPGDGALLRLLVGEAFDDLGRGFG
ncbi:TetR family transcriptional regulator [Actinomycetospora sp. TBRC 11914]|uniref:acyl-CoA-like ligand-binding transcription factor n=1 Tax=Actinomycetospora sp. TBRC 11914 TaxID=2729387 RepID=UPI00145F5DD1|nr:TetR family transcriptional regulator [Actinomycetospora sp. TBRC 11914]NMO88980.1 TetR family transcriptional regulator [Actinomycetospora sp. TBRC 11914]